MRVGVMILPERRWHDGAVRWQEADAMGFDSAWTYDHIWWRSLKDGPWFSPIPTLAAAAAITKRIRLGLLVASPNFRHPVLLAKDAIAIDDISRGRFVLGIGAGAADAGDAEILGRSCLTRHDRRVRFREFVYLTDRLLRDAVTTYTGSFYAAHEARMIPGCTRSPRLPLVIAGTGRTGMALAARSGDAWVTTGPTDWSRSYCPDECLGIVAAQLARLRHTCAQVDRDPNSLARIFIATSWAGEPLDSVDSCVELAQRYAAIGITDLIIHWPRETGAYAGDVRTLERIASSALPRIRGL